MELSFREWKHLPHFSYDLISAVLIINCVTLTTDTVTVTGQWCRQCGRTLVPRSWTTATSERCNVRRWHVVRWVYCRRDADWSATFPRYRPHIPTTLPIQLIILMCR